MSETKQKLRLAGVGLLALLSGCDGATINPVEDAHLHWTLFSRPRNARPDAMQDTGGTEK